MMKKYILASLLLFGSAYSGEFSVKVNENEGSAISEIVTTLGKSNLVALGLKKSHLKSLGGGLKGIGPLHFLGYIMSKDELKSYMRTIKKSSMKWNGFMDGLKPGFERELKEGKLAQDLPEFAKLVGVNPEQLLAKANEQNWDGFVELLIEEKK
jgi:hypothetical protein